MNDQKQMDALARSQGFSDYETAVAWHRHRSANLRGRGLRTQAPSNFLQRLIGQPTRQGENVFESLLGPIYPSAMFKRITRRIDKGMGGL